MQDEALRALSELVGRSDWLSLESQELAWAQRDAAGDYRLYGVADRIGRVWAVVHPHSSQEVAAVVQWAARYQVPLVARGGGTGVMGGAVPLGTAVVVDCSGLDQIVVHPDSAVVEAGAGVPLGRLNAALAEFNLMVPHDPWSVAMATVGGAISTDGVGYLAGRWGSMGQQVIALEMVTPDGAIVQTQPYKPSLGPDLRALVIGSQGGFGFVTRAWLTAVARPEQLEFAAWRFAGFEAGFAAVLRLWRAGLRFDLFDYTDGTPEALELEPGPQDETGRTAILRLGAFGLGEEVSGRMQAARRLIREGQPLGPDLARQYWDTRYAIADRWREQVHTSRNLRERARLGGMGLDYLNLALWPEKIPSYRRRVLEVVAETSGIEVGEIGLWGTPWLFSAVFWETAARPEPTDQPPTPGQYPDRMRRLLSRLIAEAQAAGGNAECIHGIGLKGLPWLAGEAGFSLLARLKSLWDPQDLLNRGKFSPWP